MMHEYMQAGKITASTEYREFEQLAKNDARFLSSLQVDKESLFREFIRAIKQAKDERSLLLIRRKGPAEEELPCHAE